MTDRELVDKYINYIIKDMANMYNINENKAKDLFYDYDFEALANEYPN